MTRDDPPLCPSARGKPGATLIGISAGPGALGYVTPAVTVDEQFLAAAGDNPEERFRFASRCHESGCHNWGEDRCQLIHQIMSRHPTDEEPGDLPACGIRSSCRWFAQAGREACRVCPVVRNPGADHDTLLRTALRPARPAATATDPSQLQRSGTPVP
ncbi:MAG TPA: hypothetical protein VGS19_20525 [Streptosporangiaceae bacterium]|nr:hypothetical protein [Streptosporangiaceae bacterium]